MVTKKQVEEALKRVMDPELMMDIVTLELVYKIAVESDHVDIDMTFTTPLCPYGQQLVDEVKAAVVDIKGIKTVEVNVVFDPPWKPSAEVLATLGV